MLERLKRTTESGLGSLLSGGDASHFASLMSGLQSSGLTHSDNIVSAAASNNEKAVLEILAKHPEKVIS